MRYLLKVCKKNGTAIAFAAFAPDAFAQEITYIWTCQTVGSDTPEPLGLVVRAIRSRLMWLVVTPRRGR